MGTDNIKLSVPLFLWLNLYLRNWYNNHIYYYNPKRTPKQQQSDSKTTAIRQ